VDRGHWEFQKPLAPGEHMLGERTQNDVREELHSPLPRFVIPPAQAQLFRLGYGFQLEKPSGDGFERTLLQWFETLLLAAHGGTLRDLLSRLGHRQVDAVPETKLDFSGSFACFFVFEVYHFSIVEKEIFFSKGVVTVESRVKIEPKNLDSDRKSVWARVKS